MFGLMDVVSIIQLGLDFKSVFASKASMNNAVISEINSLRGQVEQLSDRLWVANKELWVHDTTIPPNRQKIITNLRDIKEVAHPVAEKLGANMLYSAGIYAPDRAQQAFSQNPFKCLMDIEPLSLYSSSSKSRNDMPVVFNYDGTLFVGHQKIGAIDASFNLSSHFPQSIQPVVPQPDTKKTPQQRDARFGFRLGFIGSILFWGFVVLDGPPSGDQWLPAILIIVSTTLAISVCTSLFLRYLMRFLRWIVS